MWHFPWTSFSLAISLLQCNTLLHFISSQEHYLPTGEIISWGKIVLGNFQGHLRNTSTKDTTLWAFVCLPPCSKGNISLKKNFHVSLLKTPISPFQKLVINKSLLISSFPRYHFIKHIFNQFHSIIFLSFNVWSFLIRSFISCNLLWTKICYQCSPLFNYLYFITKCLI